MLLRTLTLLLIGGACQGQLNVLYTGRTLGYLRFPELQSPALRACVAETNTMTGAAKGFYDLLNIERSGPPSLTVGMGDNFGPELGARSFDGFPPGAPETRQIPHPGKDLFVWDSTLTPKEWVADTGVSKAMTALLMQHKGDIPVDNVGCFLRAAGYDAIVPGKHDFEAGPEHVIMLAKFLASGDQPFSKTTMVAANLAISTAQPDAQQRLPLYQIEYGFKEIETKRRAANLPSYSVMFPADPDKPTPTPDLPDTIFPWQQEISVLNAFSTSPLTADLYGKWNLVANTSDPTTPLPSILAAAAGNTTLQLVQLDDKGKVALNRPAMLTSRIGTVQLCENKTRDPFGFLNDLTPTCTVLREKTGADLKAHESGKVTFTLKEPLRPDRNYAVCILMGQPQKFSCKPFYVSEPFLASETGKINKWGDFDADPYLVKKVGSESVAVFGVVDPVLQNEIGRFNETWWNDREDYETSVLVADPAASLTQALMRCKQNPDCNGARKVLLAQMPAFKAIQLLNSIDSAFDLVVAQTDGANKTVEVTLSRTLKNDQDAPNFVVTPDDLYSLGKVTYTIQKATIEAKPTAGGKTNWTLTNRLPEGVWSKEIKPPAPGSPSLRDAAIAALAARHVNGPTIKDWSNAQILQRLALLLMQVEQHTDISMLQQRDLFEPQTYGPALVQDENLQELLDRIFWKNDFAVNAPLTGATLTAILSASSDFAALDSNPLNTDLERGRNLVSLGVFKDSATGNWAVNGSVLDPAKLYSVTMTDFLALGDTGYAQLKTPAVPLPYRIADFKSLHSVSALVCRAIAASNKALTAAKCLRDDLMTKTYLDPSNQAPSDNTPGLNSLKQAEAYLNPKLRRNRAKDFYKGQNDAEVASAQKPFWSLSLEKGDFGALIDLHKRFTGGQVQTQSLTNQFSGVQLSAATAPDSYTYTFDNRTRIKRSSQRLDLYGLDDMSLSYARTQDTSDNNFNRNLSVNTLSLEAGSLLHLETTRRPARRSPRQIDFLLAARMDSQLLSPIEEISVNSQTCLSTSDCLTANPCGAGVSSTAAAPCLSGGSTLRGTIRRSVDLYGKAGLRFSDSQSWIEFGLLEGRSLQVPYALKLNNGQTSPNNLLYLQPGSAGGANCAAGVTTSPCLPPAGQGFQDWLAYLSYYGYVSSATKFSGVYQTRPLDGVFLNFSLSLPLPFVDTWGNWSGGKQISFLAENNGRFLFNHANDIASQTKWLDNLSLSLVIPTVGNLSFKPAVQLVYFSDKVVGLQFHSINYVANLSYTFDWRSGQSLRRVWRYASPAASATVPSSGN